jgi:hypothetical protein
MLLALTLACTASEESTPLLYDAERSGLAGQDGPWGVQLRSVLYGDPPTDVYGPITEAGELANVGLATVTIVLLQGGGVVPERYDWLAIHLASRGATVLVPHHGLDLASVDPTAGERALAAAINAGDVEQGSPVGVAGHSLGGVMAAEHWVGDETVNGLALLASYPADDTPVEDRKEGSVISIVGTSDGKVTVNQAEEGAARFNVENALVKVEGLTHYDWTDAPYQSEVDADGSSPQSRTDVRRIALYALDGWVDSCVTSTVGTWARFRAENPEAADTNPCPLMVMGG